MFVTDSNGVKEKSIDSHDESGSGYERMKGPTGYLKRIALAEDGIKLLLGLKYKRVVEKKYSLSSDARPTPK